MYKSIGLVKHFGKSRKKVIYSMFS